jgi:CO/xanthine dehydrogenase Mo-binding subunit
VHGQGHETTLAQLAADELGVPIESISLRFGDTRRTPFGAAGTGGSGRRRSRAAPPSSPAAPCGSASSRSPPICSKRRLTIW